MLAGKLYVYPFLRSKCDLLPDLSLFEGEIGQCQQFLVQVLLEILTQGKKTVQHSNPTQNDCSKAYDVKGQVNKKSTLHSTTNKAGWDNTARWQTLIQAYPQGCSILWALLDHADEVPHKSIGCHHYLHQTVITRLISHLMLKRAAFDSCECTRQAANAYIGTSVMRLMLHCDCHVTTPQDDKCWQLQDPFCQGKIAWSEARD